MSFDARHRYTGPIRAVVFDWAGTVVDHGCAAPTLAFVRLFAKHGVEVSDEEARGPMGMHKREHIRHMMKVPRIAALWTEVHGMMPTPEDVDRLYDEATAVQVALLPERAEPIPGVLELVEALRARGIRIGSTTGYNREMLDVVAEAAKAHGFTPDVAIPSSEVPEGRPAPYLCWAALTQLGVWPAAAAVKVGDTPVDMQAGRHAGTWTVGYARTGNLVGLDAQDALQPEAAPRIAEARATLEAAGAHYVVDGPEALLGVIEQIDKRLAAGEQP